MARNCFYCGRELAAGERCRCKSPDAGSAGTSTASANASRTAASSSGSASAGKSQSSAKKSRVTPLWPRGKSSKAQKTTGSSGAGRSGANRSRQPLLSRLRTFRDQVRTLFPTLSRGIMTGAQYFIRPASKIRQESLRVSRPFSCLFIVFFALLTGLLGLLMSRSGAPLYTTVVTLILGRGLSLLYAHPYYAFAAITGFSILFVMVLCGAFYVAARFSNRKPTFRKMVDLVSLSLVYPVAMEVFLLITILLGSRGSLSLIIVSILLMSITHLLSFRSALALTEDAVFFFLMFVYISSYLFLSVLLSAGVRILIA